MRSVRMILASVLLCLPLFCQAQKSLYDTYKDMKRVSAVYISKAMIDMDPGLFAKDMNLGKVIEQLNSVQVLSTMDNNVKKEMRKDIRALVSSSKYELLMEQKGHVSSSEFYIYRKGNKVKELIMIVDGPASLKFVRLEGNMTLKDIQNIVSHSKTGMNIDHSFFKIAGSMSYLTDAGNLRELENLKELAELKNLEILENLEGLNALKELEGIFSSENLEYLKKYMERL